MKHYIADAQLVNAFPLYVLHIMKCFRRYIRSSHNGISRRWLLK